MRAQGHMQQVSNGATTLAVPPSASSHEEEASQQQQHQQQGHSRSQQRLHQPRSHRRTNSRTVRTADSGDASAAAVAAVLMGASSSASHSQAALATSSQPHSLSTAATIPPSHGHSRVPSSHTGTTLLALPSQPPPAPPTFMHRSLKRISKRFRRIYRELVKGKEHDDEAEVEDEKKRQKKLENEESESSEESESDEGEEEVINKNGRRSPTIRIMRSRSPSISVSSGLPSHHLKPNSVAFGTIASSHSTATNRALPTRSNIIELSHSGGVTLSIDVTQAKPAQQPKVLSKISKKTVERIERKGGGGGGGGSEKGHGDKGKEGNEKNQRSTANPKVSASLPSAPFPSPTSVTSSHNPTVYAHDTPELQRLREELRKIEAETQNDEREYEAKLAQKKQREEEEEVEQKEQMRRRSAVMSGATSPTVEKTFDRELLLATFHTPALTNSHHHPQLNLTGGSRSSSTTSSSSALLPIIPYTIQGDLEMYTQVNLDRRMSIKMNAEFVRCIQKLWCSFFMTNDSTSTARARRIRQPQYEAGKNGQPLITRAMYVHMLVQIYTYLFELDDNEEKEKERVEEEKRRRKRMSLNIDTAMKYSSPPSNTTLPTPTSTRNGGGAKIMTFTTATTPTNKAMSSSQSNEKIDMVESPRAVTTATTAAASSEAASTRSTSPQPPSSHQLALRQMHATLSNDIRTDIHGRTLTFMQFHESLFQLIDLWSITSELEEYVDIAEEIYKGITRECTVTQKQRDMMCEQAGMDIFSSLSSLHPTRSRSNSLHPGSNRGSGKGTKVVWIIGPDGFPIQQAVVDTNERANHSRNGSRSASPDPHQRRGGGGAGNESDRDLLMRSPSPTGSRTKLHSSSIIPDLNEKQRQARRAARMELMNQMSPDASKRGSTKMSSENATDDTPAKTNEDEPQLGTAASRAGGSKMRAAMMIMKVTKRGRGKKDRGGSRAFDENIEYDDDEDGDDGDKDDDSASSSTSSLSKPKTPQTSHSRRPSHFVASSRAPRDWKEGEVSWPNLERGGEKEASGGGGGGGGGEGEGGDHDDEKKDSSSSDHQNTSTLSNSSSTSDIRELTEKELSRMRRLFGDKYISQHVYTDEEGRSFMMHDKKQPLVKYPWTNGWEKMKGREDDRDQTEVNLDPRDDPALHAQYTASPYESDTSQFVIYDPLHVQSNVLASISPYNIHNPLRSLMYDGENEKIAQKIAEKYYKPTTQMVHHRSLSPRSRPISREVRDEAEQEEKERMEQRWSEYVSVYGAQRPMIKLGAGQSEVSFSVSTRSSPLESSNTSVTSLLISPRDEERLVEINARIEAEKLGISLENLLPTDDLPPELIQVDGTTKKKKGATQGRPRTSPDVSADLSSRPKLVEFPDVTNGRNLRVAESKDGSEQQQDPTPSSSQQQYFLPGATSSFGRSPRFMEPLNINSNTPDSPTGNSAAVFRNCMFQHSSRTARSPRKTAQQQQQQRRQQRDEEEKSSVSEPSMIDSLSPARPISGSGVSIIRKLVDGNHTPMSSFVYSPRGSSPRGIFPPSSAINSSRTPTTGRRPASREGTIFVPHKLDAAQFLEDIEDRPSTAPSFSLDLSPFPSRPSTSNGLPVSYRPRVNTSLNDTPRVLRREHVLGRSVAMTTTSHPMSADELRSPRSPQQKIRKVAPLQHHHRPHDATHPTKTLTELLLEPSGTNVFVHEWTEKMRRGETRMRRDLYHAKRTTDA